jgi:hypothetical protein
MHHSNFVTFFRNFLKNQSKLHRSALYTGMDFDEIIRVTEADLLDVETLLDRVGKN